MKSLRRNLQVFDEPMRTGKITVLLMTVFIEGRSSLGATLLAGALCGLATATVVFIAKGGWSSGDVPYALPTGAVEGLIMGMVVRWLLS